MRQVSEFTVKVRYFPGDRVKAINYRKRTLTWESGTVQDVIAKFDGRKFITVYSVLLDRKVPNPTIGNPKGLLMLHTISSFIKPLKEKANAD